MKTLKDLTPKIKNKIPKYIEQCTKPILNGDYYTNFNIDNAVEAIRYNYKLYSQEIPVVLYTENPYEQKLLFNFIRLNIKKYYPILQIIKILQDKYFYIKTSVNNRDIQIKLPSIYKILLGNIKSDPQLDSQLRLQLYSELDSQLRSQLDSQLNSELDSQLSSQLDLQLYSQLDSQLRSQLDSQLSSELDSQLRSQLSSQLDSQLNSQLSSKLKSNLNLNKKELYKYHNSFLYVLNVYSNIYFTWYSFLKDEFELKLNINDLFEKEKELYINSGIYSCIFSKLLAIVSKYPKKIHQNKNDFRLHNTKEEAVVWGNSFKKFNCHYVNGRHIDSNLFNEVVNGEFTFKKFQKLQNEDEKAAIITIIKENKGNEGVLEFLGAYLVDTQTIIHKNGYTETQKLYKTKEKFSWANDSKGNNNVELAWNEMICPSTGTTYLIETCPTFNNVLDSAKWLRPTNVPIDLDYVWQSAN